MNIRPIQVLSEAEVDLEDGSFFYESREQGVGEYFWDSLLSDIESLILYAGVHSLKCMIIVECLQSGFRIQFITI